MISEYCSKCKRNQTVNMNRKQVRCYSCGAFIRNKTDEEVKEITKLVTQPFRKFKV